MSEQTRTRRAYPFTAIVGQDALRHALLLTAVDPSLGGVLAIGDRGTGKTTAVRALAGLLPPQPVARGCPYGCAPDAPSCPHCTEGAAGGRAMRPVPVVDLPLGAGEDRVTGALDIERALIDGEKAFEPGLLAKANRGFLYIDEVNLLEDHIVDLLLDVAASGWNVVERDGLSVRHPARFVLVGSGNPEEGELRPQLLDRFGLCVEVTTPADASARVEIIRRREAFERDPAAFAKRFARSETKQRTALRTAQERLAALEPDDVVLLAAAELCIALGTDGLRGELTLAKAMRAHAALSGAERITLQHLRDVAPFALGHRLRRDPLDDARGSVRVSRAVEEVLAAREAA